MVKKQKLVIWIYTVSFSTQKADAIYGDIAEDVERRFGISNYELKRPLPEGKNKKVIGVTKDELGGKIIKEFLVLKTKTYSHLIDDEKED